MIKKLRTKFIAAAMISIGLVLFVIIAGINIANYSRLTDRASERLSMLVENEGHIPPPGPDHPGFTAEAPFTIRYFMICVSDDGKVTEINMDKIAAISEADAISAAIELSTSHELEGFYKDYRYFGSECEVADGVSGIQYFFVDCHEDLRTFEDFLIASILISVIGLVLVFLLVVVFSGIVFKPVQESVAKQKRFITDASHELKTPLTIIDANTEIIEMESGENEWTKSIRNQVNRLTDMTNKLVFLSRMDEENHVLQKQDFSLSDAVEDAAFPYIAVAEAKGKKLDLDIQENIHFQGDEGQIRQVVSLLLDNAIKYSAPKDGKIRLSLAMSGKQKRLMVWNNTEEIAIGNHDVLFDRFYRSDQSRNSKTGGHGIGLSVVKAIVLAHKGRISAKSEDGKSILFTITL